MVRKEKSAAAVVYRDTDQKRYFLLLRYEAGHWGFVKGHIEKNESEKEALLREVKEETGIDDISFKEGFRKEISYFFRQQNELIHKQVVFFLAETETIDVKLSFEHKDYIWLEHDKALEKLTFRNAKDILNDAVEHLNS